MILAGGKWQQKSSISATWPRYAPTQSPSHMGPCACLLARTHLPRLSCLRVQPALRELVSLYGRGPVMLATPNYHAPTAIPPAAAPRGRSPICVTVCARIRSRLSGHASVHLSVRLCVCAFVHACVRMCVRVCVRACGRAGPYCLNMSGP